MRKRIGSLLLVLTIMGSFASPIMAQEIRFQLASPRAFIGNQEISLELAPEIINGSSYIPIQLVTEAFDVTLEWNQASKSIIMLKDGYRTTLKTSDYFINPAGNTLISLNFIAENFNQEVKFNAQTKEISLLPLIPPIAQFKIESDTYMVGSPMRVINDSYSPEGESIIESLWEVTHDNKSFQTKNLSQTLKKLEPGKYTIKLKVKNSKQAWSQWSQASSIEIKPEPKPEITSFAAISLEFDQGEGLDFKYNTILAPGRNVDETRWSYQREGNLDKTFGKPRALFKEGTYTVTLEIKDDNNAWSLPVTTQVKITDQVIKSELEFRMESVRMGEVFDNYDEYNFQNYEPVEDFTAEQAGPTLLFSNSPETVLSKGVLYRDKVVGDTRLLYHHRNGMPNSPQNSKLVIIAENHGKEAVTISQTKGSTAGASKDILHLGQIVTRRYFNSALDNKIVIQPNEKRYLYNSGGNYWGAYESFSGVLEFNADKIVTITVAAVDQDFQIKDSGNLPALARDGIHTRGTFPQANKYYNISIPGDRPSKLFLGQREDEMDYWIDGYDAMTGTAEKNKGNYGVLYDMNLTADEKTAVLFNPRGTSFKGAFRWEDVRVTLAPRQGMFIGSRESAVAGMLEKRRTNKLYYTLSNGSSGPILLNFIPELFWEDYQIEKAEEIE